MAITTRKIFPLDEGQAFRYRALLVDQDGVAITLADLVTITLTLYDTATSDSGTPSYINSRNAQNVKNANGVTIYATPQTASDGTLYNLQWDGTALESIIVDATQLYELHRARFDFTYGSSPVKPGRREVDFYVRNLRRAT